MVHATIKHPPLLRLPLLSPPIPSPPLPSPPIPSPPISVPPPHAGGMAGFVLALFHKLEMKYRGPYDIVKAVYGKCCSGRKGQQQARGDATDAGPSVRLWVWNVCMMCGGVMCGSVMCGGV